MPTRVNSIDLAALRRYATARSLFAQTTLSRALQKLAFVQADPIRAPARAQDLTLRLRVRNYRAGDLEALYPKLSVEEDFFVNYGFVTTELHRLMHPRRPRASWPTGQRANAQQVLEFVRERGIAHPREVDAHFQHGKTRNWFGGSSNASTQLLNSMHYRGLLRVARREGGVRCYAVREEHLGAPDGASALDAMVDIIVRKYAPLPSASLSQLVMFLYSAAPQWREGRRAALDRAKGRLGSTTLDGVRWFWPADENPASKRHVLSERVAFLAPFDPIVWDRRRFELLWGWAYRFEAYTPAAKRERGYYAMPLLWRDHIAAWANASVCQGRLTVQIGHLDGTAPRHREYREAVQAEAQSMAGFLGLETEAHVRFD